MKKRILSALLAAAMMLTMAPAAFAAEDTVGTATELKQAIENAQSGDVITLSNDITMSPDYAMSEEKPEGEKAPLRVAMTLTQDVTLNLNGHTIKWDTTNIEQLDLWYTLCFLSVSGGKLTVTGNGTIDCDAGYNNAYGVNITNNGEATVNSGTFKGSMTAFQVQTGTLTVNGGSFSLAKTISTAAPQYAKYIINAIDKNYKAGTAKIFVKGGTFSYNISNSPEGAGTSYVAEGYVSVANGDKFDVKPLSEVAVAEISGTPYRTLVDAVKNAANGATIKLLKDASGAGVGTFKGAQDGTGVKNFTIDFGGHTYTCTGPAVGSSGTQSQILLPRLMVSITAHCLML